MTDTKPKKARVREHYIDTLDVITKARYVEKISKIDGHDPYELPKSAWSRNVEDLPNITYPHIYNYLVNKLNAYTLEDMCSYKSLDSYTYFVSGWVKDVVVFKVNNATARDVCLVSARVRHSQRMNETPLHPWLIAEKNGNVVSAHCNCMAGLSESCSHVGAMMFAVDATVKLRDSQTVTQQKAYWLLPSTVTKVTGKPVKEIDFTSAKTKKRKLDKHIDQTINSADTPKPPKKNVQDIPGPTAEELQKFYRTIYSDECKPALLSLVPEYSQHYIPKVLSKKYPMVLSELRDEQFLQVERDQLIKHCEKVMQEMKITTEEVRNVEELTREQAKSREWFRFRTGRVTASKMRNVCRASLENPSQSLVKSICYPDVYRFTSQATKWGCKHEKDALEAYIQQMKDEHENFSVRESGFVISEKYPFIGASPDGIASCDCCGEVCVEIKCPYCKRDASIKDSLDSNFCLRKCDDDQIRLKRNHPYYYQIQCQLMVCEMEFSDFIVWTNVDYHAERICLDAEICSEMVKKSSKFFTHSILPELIGKLYSRPSSA
ncbi:uncharacterized protein [Argopecten irradians]|uniref:uncharacterized protein n=1 Tax=Argopecten irradians TaxID=31199 RepID=UPI0037112FB9